MSDDIPMRIQCPTCEGYGLDPKTRETCETCHGHKFISKEALLKLRPEEES